jgi:hypothetical protein
MTTIDAAFRQELEAHPTNRVEVIVRTRGDPRQHLAQVMAAGLTVRHTYSLIHALAATGLGTSVLRLVDEPWVDRIERDAEVRTME